MLRSSQAGDYVMVVDGGRPTDGHQKLRDGKVVEIVKEGEEGKYKAEDLVMPLPGTGISLEGRVLKVYDEVLGGMGLDWKDFKTDEKETTLGGDWRRVVASFGNPRHR